jgi:hypothetical protein
MISAYGVSREWRKVATRRIIAAAALAAGLGGCSMSIPGFIDRQPTGSIRPKTYPFAAEDWSVVEPVLRASLRAEEGADPATWANADSGRRGEVLGVGRAFTRDGAVCRTFTARIEEAGASRRMQATGCESRDKDLAISDAAPFKGI